MGLRELTEEETKTREKVAENFKKFPHLTDYKSLTRAYVEGTRELQRIVRDNVEFKIMATETSKEGGCFSVGNSDEIRQEFPNWGLPIDWSFRSMGHYWITTRYARFKENKMIEKEKLLEQIDKEVEKIKRLYEPIHELIRRYHNIFFAGIFFPKEEFLLYTSCRFCDDEIRREETVCLRFFNRNAYNDKSNFWATTWIATKGILSLQMILGLVSRLKDKRDLVLENERIYYDGGYSKQGD